jgi:ArsR family transcriptional regulator
MSSFEGLADCPSLFSGPLAQAPAERIATALKVLADPARLRLLSQIASEPSGEACVCTLNGPLNLQQPTVSHHLKVLYEAGLLDRERRGLWVYYRLIPGRLQSLERLLSEQPVAVAATG